MKNVTDRDDLTGVLRDLDVRLHRQERHTHHGIGAVEGPGGMGISGDHNNASHLGADNGMYTREICVKATPPTPYDFGGRLVPGSIWVGVGVAEPEPEPTCPTITDDFERSDLGAEWVLPSTSYDPFGTVNAIEHLTIVTGAVTGPLTTGGTRGIDFNTATVGPEGGHYVESTFTLPPGDPASSALSEIFWYMLFDPATWTGIAAWVVQNTEGPFGGFRLRMVLWNGGGSFDDTSYDYFHEWPSTSHTMTIRFEVTTDGLMTALIGGTALDIGAGDPFYQFDVTGITLGNQVGISTRVDYFSVTMPVPHVETITFGCLEA